LSIPRRATSTSLLGPALAFPDFDDLQMDLAPGLS
jgi:hypothetical protein